LQDKNPLLKMGLETVKEEIVRNAKEQETALIAEARKEANRIMKEVEKKIEDVKEKSNAEIKKKIDVIKKQELTSAELENKKMLLEAKKELIESVFIEVRKKLASLDDEKRESYIKKLLEKAENDIEVANVYCNKGDLEFLKDFNTEAVDITSGLIAENKDTTIRVDYSFETMLQSIKENELQSINKILFG
tara:strand:+ start:1988 stop:2560 length:573 start_codon:yes stop_codon:yes gene_type:complete